MSDFGWSFNIKQRVKPARSRRDDDRWEGHVVARELYETTGGRTQYIYVRWMSETGEPANDTVRYEAWELEAL